MGPSPFRKLKQSVGAGILCTVLGVPVLNSSAAVVEAPFLVRISAAYARACDESTLSLERAVLVSVRCTETDTLSPQLSIPMEAEFFRLTAGMEDGLIPSALGGGLSGWTSIGNDVVRVQQGFDRHELVLIF